MRTLRFLLAAGILGVLGVLAVLYLFDTETYDVKGRVAGLRNDTTLVVEHERIPGYMPPMTMPMPVKDPQLLNGLEPGDAIQFRLQVSDESANIVDLRTIDDDLVPEHPGVSRSPRPATSGSQTSRLREGDRVPSDLSLTSHSGETISLDRFRGKGLVLTFIYTRCPLPTYCPRMSNQFAALQPKLRSEYGDEVQLLSISFDPAYDTPKVLREYAGRYTDRLDTWTFTTGDSTQIDRATSLFGVYTSDGDGEITHNLVTAVVGPKGRVQELFRGNDWTESDVMRAVTDALGPASD